MTFAEVLLPLPLSGTFTYSVPPDMLDRIKPGHRVIVPFGRSKFYTGIVESTGIKAPEGYEVKPVALALDDKPVLRHPQLKLWHWIADYYLCSPGEVFRAAVPAGLKIEAETFIELNPDYEETGESPLSEREAVVIQILDSAEKRLTVADIKRLSGFGSVSSVLTRLMERGAVIISERLIERYRPRKEIYVKASLDRDDPQSLNRLFDLVKSSRRQEAALLAILDATGAMRRDTDPKEVTRAQVMERTGVTAGILSSMAKKGVIEIYRKEINRFDYPGIPEGILPTLSEAQKKALDDIHLSWTGHAVTLLHGVTSSGKTEIYIHLIADALRRNMQVLYLVPEIALTTQLTHRLQRVFGDKVMIYHSKFSDNERVDIWKKMLEDPSPRVIIGVRSSVFLPFGYLGLVIVDEEHETSYKQQDPAPRYNGRDAAMVLASMHGAKTLLGSATPTIDTYYKASTGRYGLVTLTERFEGAQPPRIEIVDMSQARRSGAATGAFSRTTRRLVAEAIGRGEQAILFLNRRGYAPVARCRMCAHIPKCSHCDVSLTYHRHADKLVCHYCGATYPLPDICPACREPSIEVVGYGTERIEEELAIAFPDGKIARMDLDTTRNKDGYEQIIESFSRGDTNILVGTQMVTKGLDFDRVSVVGVINADAVINFPDFRSTERAFSMIEQVAGRAGRRHTRGVVSVQTSQPDHPVFPFITAHDYNAFYEYAVEERRKYAYPPFSRLIYIYIKHPDVDSVVNLSAAYASRLRAMLGNRVFGPEEPAVARIQSLYIRKIMLKIETEASMTKVKALLRGLYEEMHLHNPAMRRAVVYYDVDPV